MSPTALPAPYRDAALPIDQRVEDLLARMTLDEKIGQLSQVFARPEDDKEIQAVIRDSGAGSRILATSMHAGSDAQQSMTYDSLHESQRIAVEETRLGVPLLFGRDVIHGHLTVFPIPLAQAASWDPPLVEQAAAIAAKEAAADYVHWTFAPMLDIARDARWGRIIEGCGEDPWLCAELGAAMVRGFQGNDVSHPDRIMACAKHFAGYGAAEGGRDYNTVEISENTLRNVYLPPFQAAVEAGVSTIMCAFHDLNGRPCTTNRFLLDTVLRKEWGFEGFVISDWASVEETVMHGTSADLRDAAAQALTAGVDLEMVRNCYAKHARELVEEGVISLALIDGAVRRLLTAKFRLGLFERPYTPRPAAAVELLPEHRACSRNLAARSIVLLKNPRTSLPLDPSAYGKLALIGPMAHVQRELLGNWTLDGRPEDTVSILAGLLPHLPQLQHCTADAPTDTQLRLAARADVVIIAVGEDHLRNGEGANLADIMLPPGQEELIEAVHRLGKKIILVICSGRPLVLTRIEPLADSILWAWQPGTEAGNAIADILVGKVNPSGKLPVTLPRATGQIPIYYNYKSTGRPVDDYHGSASRYQDIAGKPLYQFGYGLSYTTYAYSDFQISSATIPVGQTVEVSALVTNTGERSGEEIVQCYVRDPVASTVRPVRELKGFRREPLEPGESRRVAFRLGEKELRYFGIDGTARVDPGKFQVWIGGDSSASLGGEFHVTASAQRHS